MRILGIDPGSVSGWALYVDTDAGRYVEASGTFEGHAVHKLHAHVLHTSSHVAIERPKGYGPTRPDLVDCGYVCGRIAGWLALTRSGITELTRLEVCKTLTDATHGAVRVKNDATAWAALVLLHGDGSDRKPRRKKGVVIDQGGPLGGVSSHARAALAVAVAFCLRAEAVGAARAEAQR